MSARRCVYPDIGGGVVSARRVCPRRRRRCSLLLSAVHCRCEAGGCFVGSAGGGGWCTGACGGGEGSGGGGGGGVTGYLLMRGLQMSLMYNPESWGTVLWR